MRKFINKLIENRQRSVNLKIAEKLRNTEYPNETVYFVYTMLNERSGL